MRTFGVLVLMFAAVVLFLAAVLPTRAAAGSSAPTAPKTTAVRILPTFQEL
jgi:hypothetical protein